MNGMQYNHYAQVQQLAMLQNMLMQKTQELEQLKSYVGRLRSNEEEPVSSWSYEQPPKMPQSLRYRILSAVLRDTSKLQFLMKPKNAIKLSTNFVNFGHKNSDSLEDDLHQVLTVESDLSMTVAKNNLPSTVCRYYLTGITNSNDKNKRKNMFRHSILNDS